MESSQILTREAAELYLAPVVEGFYYKTDVNSETPIDLYQTVGDLSMQNKFFFQKECDNTDVAAM